MKLILTHFIFQAKILLRTPAFLVPTLLFPAILYSFLGNIDRDHGMQNYVLASLAVYGVFGVGLFQFGTSIATERESPFNPWMKTLRGSTLPQLLGRIMTALCFAVVATGLLFVVGQFITDITLSGGQLAALFSIAMLAMVPSILAGMLIGNLCGARSAVAVANLVYLPLAFLGGLFINPTLLPNFMQRLSELTLTRHLGELGWAVVGGRALPDKSLMVVAIYTVVLAVLVVWAMRRDQNKRFG